MLFLKHFSSHFSGNDQFFKGLSLLALLCNLFGPPRREKGSCPPPPPFADSHTQAGSHTTQYILNLRNGKNAQLGVFVKPLTLLDDSSSRPPCKKTAASGSLHFSPGEHSGFSLPCPDRTDSCPPWVLGHGVGGTWRWHHSLLFLFPPRHAQLLSGAWSSRVGALGLGSGPLPGGGVSGRSADTVALASTDSGQLKFVSEIFQPESRVKWNPSPSGC